MKTDLPDAVYELLATRINTFEKLELVVALSAAPSSKASVDELCRTLKLPRDLVRQATIDLRASSLITLTSRGEAQLLPVTQKDEAALKELVQLYAGDPMSIVKALGDIAMSRLRSMATRAIADAFVLRKKTPKDGNDG